MHVVINNRRVEYTSSYIRNLTNKELVKLLEFADDPLLRELAVRLENKPEPRRG